VKLRGELWPDVKESELWNRANFTGFTTIPRTISLILRIIDELDRKNAARVYLDLWCRSFDDYVIEVRDEYEMAFASGYHGQRAVRTWRERLAVIENFGFVKTHRASHGAFRLVLLLDPHKVIERLHEEQKIEEEDWIALRSMLITIGELTD